MANDTENEAQDEPRPECAKTPEKSGDEASKPRRVMGTSSQEFDHSLFQSLIDSLWLPRSTSPEVRDREIGALLSAVTDLAARDAAEGMLITQMIATHHGAMECFRRAMIESQTFEGRESSLKHAVRLTKAYTDMLSALNKHRGRGQQKITIEHVNVAPGGQAIVGSVQTGGRPQSDPDHSGETASGTGPVIEAGASPVAKARRKASGKGKTGGEGAGQGQAAIGHQASAVMPGVKARKRSPARKG